MNVNDEYTVKRRLEIIKPDLERYVTRAKKLAARLFGHGMSATLRVVAAIDYAKENMPNSISTTTSWDALFLTILEAAGLVDALSLNISDEGKRCPVKGCDRLRLSSRHARCSLHQKLGIDSRQLTDAKFVVWVKYADEWVPTTRRSQEAVGSAVMHAIEQGFDYVVMSSVKDVVNHDDEYQRAKDEFNVALREITPEKVTAGEVGLDRLQEAEKKLVAADRSRRSMRAARAGSHFPGDAIRAMQDFSGAMKDLSQSLDPPRWTKQDGTRVSLLDMTDQHILNAYLMLRHEHRGSHQAKGASA